MLVRGNVQNWASLAFPEGSLGTPESPKFVSHSGHSSSRMIIRWSLGNFSGLPTRKARKVRQYLHLSSLGEGEAHLPTVNLFKQQKVEECILFFPQGTGNFLLLRLWKVCECLKKLTSLPPTVSFTELRVFFFNFFLITPLSLMEKMSQPELGR